MKHSAGSYSSVQINALAQADNVRKGMNRSVVSAAQLTSDDSQQRASGSDDVTPSLL